MIIRLNDNPSIIVSSDTFAVIVNPDYQPVHVTGNTYYNFVGSGCTQVITHQTGNLITGVIYTPCDTGVTQAQFSNYTGATEIRLQGIEADINFLSGQTDLLIQGEISLAADINYISGVTDNIIADISYLSGQTDTKLDTSIFSTYSGTTAPAQFAAKVHTHPQYSLTGHTHIIANVTGLQAALDSKSNTGHTHSQYATIVQLTGHTSNSSIHTTMTQVNNAISAATSGFTTPYTFTASGIAVVSQTGQTINYYVPPDAVSAITWSNVSNKPAWLTGNTLNEFESAHAHSQYLTGFTVTAPMVTGITDTLYVHNDTFTGYTDITAPATYLKLNQTIPQSVTGGSPTFYGIQFNMVTGQTQGVGKLIWGEDDTLEFGLSADVNLQIGQETVVKCKNLGAEITNGQIVYVNGASGMLPTIALADNTFAFQRPIGMATEDISNTGFVTVFGIVRDINTNAYSAGTTLYLGTGGTYTNVLPDAPAARRRIGVVLHQGTNNGIILFNGACAYKMTDLSDVDGTPLTTTGQIPVWDNSAGYFDFTSNINDFTTTGTTAQLRLDLDTFSGDTQTMYTDVKEVSGFLNGSAIDISYSHADRKITLTGDLTYYWRGDKRTLSSPWTSVAHSGVTGSWYLSTTDGTNFTWSNQSWNFYDMQVAYGYYNTLSASTFFVRETHNMMEWETHRNLHYNLGTTLQSGGQAIVGTYTENLATDAGVSPSFSSAVLLDEDLQSTIPQWNDSAGYTIMRVSGSTSIYTLNNTVPFLAAGVSYMYINNPVTGTILNGIANRWYNVYQILVPTTSDVSSQKYRMIFLLPQAAYTTLAAAQSEDTRGLRLGSLTSASAEYVIHARISYNTANAYGNYGKCVIPTNGITYVIGNKMSNTSIAGTSATNHANLGNLNWNDSGHIGTGDYLAAFNSTGVATEIPKTTFLTGFTATLSGCSDVTITSPVNDDYIRYDTGTTKWINESPVDILLNVNDGELLKRSGSAIVGATEFTGYTFTASGACEISQVGDEVIIYAPSGGTGGGTWGTITGTLSNQTDLWGALTGKSATNHTHTKASLVDFSGVTASAAELNIMDGVVATTAQINYLTGSTSNIQTQLNAKDNIAKEIVSITGATNITSATHGGKILECSGTFTITFQNSATIGTEITVINIGTGTITLAAAGTLNSSGTKLATRWTGCSVYARASNSWVAAGRLTT